MKILAISDVHDEFDRFDPARFPDFDVLVIAGDVTNWGKRHPVMWPCAQRWLRSVAALGVTKKHQYRMFIIPGNHDIGVRQFCIDGLIDIAYKRVEFDGLSFYGVPLTTCYPLPNLALTWDHMTANPEAEAAAFDFAPVDVVVSHGPPRWILDSLKANDHGDDVDHIGSERLGDYINVHAPKLVICGHIHEHAGCRMSGTQFGDLTWVYNVARHAVLIDTDNFGTWEEVI